MDTREAGKLGYQVLIKKYPPEVRREWCIKGGKAGKGRKRKVMTQMSTQEVW